jgi:hypothetical protein
MHQLEVVMLDTFVHRAQPQILLQVHQRLSIINVHQVISVLRDLHTRFHVNQDMDVQTIE